MYAPRPSSKVPTFRACSALNRTTRSSCLRATTAATADRNLITRTSLTRVRRAKSALTRCNPRTVARSDLQREMHLARISAPPTIDILEGQTCANRCTRQKWGIMRSANARDSGSRCCVLCAYYATRMQ